MSRALNCNFPLRRENDVLAKNLVSSIKTKTSVPPSQISAGNSVKTETSLPGNSGTHFGHFGQGEVKIRGNQPKIVKHVLPWQTCFGKGSSCG